MIHLGNMLAASFAMHPETQRSSEGIHEPERQANPFPSRFVMTEHNVFSKKEKICLLHVRAVGNLLENDQKACHAQSKTSKS